MFQTLYIHVKGVESKLCLDVICEMTYPFWEAVSYNQLSAISSELSFMWNIWKSEDDVFHIAQTMESVQICLNNISEKIYPTATVLLVFNSPVLLLQLMADCLWLF